MDARANLPDDRQYTIERDEVACRHAALAHIRRTSVYPMTNGAPPQPNEM